MSAEKTVSEMLDLLPHALPTPTRFHWAQHRVCSIPERLTCKDARFNLPLS